MSNIQKAIALLIESFHKYSGKEGNKDTLSKAELKELLQSELGELLGKAPDQAAVDQIFKNLDTNQDDSVDFTEFGNMVFNLTLLCHEFFTKK